MAEQKNPAEKKKSMEGINKLYEASPFKRKNKFCPKCGPGTFMAKHKNRWVCGKCGYVEMV